MATKKKKKKATKTKAAKKQRRACSVCGKLGHNRRTCPDR
jgi:hypothetical protein